MIIIKCRLVSFDHTDSLRNIMITGKSDYGVQDCPG